MSHLEFFCEVRATGTALAMVAPVLCPTGHIRDSLLPEDMAPPLCDPWSLTQGRSGVVACSTLDAYRPLDDAECQAEVTIRRDIGGQSVVIKTRLPEPPGVALVVVFEDHPSSSPSRSDHGVLVGVAIVGSELLEGLGRDQNVLNTVVQEFRPDDSLHHAQGGRRVGRVQLVLHDHQLRTGLDYEAPEHVTDQEQPVITPVRLALDRQHPVVRQAHAGRREAWVHAHDAQDGLLVPVEVVLAPVLRMARQVERLVAVAPVGSVAPHVASLPPDQKLRTGLYPDGPCFLLRASRNRVDFHDFSITERSLRIMAVLLPGDLRTAPGTGTPRRVCTSPTCRHRPRHRTLTSKGRRYEAQCTGRDRSWGGHSRRDHLALHSPHEAPAAERSARMGTPFHSHSNASLISLPMISAWSAGTEKMNSS